MRDRSYGFDVQKTLASLISRAVEYRTRVPTICGGTDAQAGTLKERAHSTQLRPLQPTHSSMRPPPMRALTPARGRVRPHAHTQAREQDSKDVESACAPSGAASSVTQRGGVTQRDDNRHLSLRLCQLKNSVCLSLSSLSLSSLSLSAVALSRCRAIAIAIALSLSLSLSLQSVLFNALKRWHYSDGDTNPRNNTTRCLLKKFTYLNHRSSPSTNASSLSSTTYDQTIPPNSHPLPQSNFALKTLSHSERLCRFDRNGVGGVAWSVLRVVLPMRALRVVRVLRDVLVLHVLRVLGVVPAARAREHAHVEEGERVVGRQPQPKRHRQEDDVPRDPDAPRRRAVRLKEGGAGRHVDPLQTEAL
eukprot:6214822-Pleurochrysis_carterae.AAC.4